MSVMCGKSSILGQKQKEFRMKEPEEKGPMNRLTVAIRPIQSVRDLICSTILGLWAVARSCAHLCLVLIPTVGVSRSVSAGMGMCVVVCWSSVRPSTLPSPGPDAAHGTGSLFLYRPRDAVHQLASSMQVHACMRAARPPIYILAVGGRRRARSGAPVDDGDSY